jgi:hypothetical protein
MINDFTPDTTPTACARKIHCLHGTIPFWNFSVTYKNKLNTCRSSVGWTPLSLPLITHLDD